MTRTDYDIWECAEHGEWCVRSLPHNQRCPRCGVVGWWRRFVRGEPYEYDDSQLEFS